MVLIFILPRVLFIFKFCTFPVFLKCSGFFWGVFLFSLGVPVFLGMLLVSSGCSGFLGGVPVFLGVPGCSGVPCSGVPVFRCSWKYYMPPEEAFFFPIA